jgi:RNA polymerase sigma-70 factor (ECF subfamily)
MDERTDEELLAAVATGPGALPEFYRRHVGKIVGMGVRRFDNPEDVADFVADVFVAVLTSAARFDPSRGRAVPWLCGLAANIAGEHIRRRQRDLELHRQVLGRTLLAPEDYSRVEEQIDAATQWRAVYANMRSLKEADRRLLELVAVDGLNTTDAANALGISAVSARVRLSRARARLRKAVDEDAFGDREVASDPDDATSTRTSALTRSET